MCLQEANISFSSADGDTANLNFVFFAALQRDSLDGCRQTWLVYESLCDELLISFLLLFYGATHAAMRHVSCVLRVTVGGSPSSDWLIRVTN